MAAETVKTTAEIDSLARKLTPNNQSYVLNTINALLYSQQTRKSGDQKCRHEKSA